MLGGDEWGVPFKDFCFETWKQRYGLKPSWLQKQYVSLSRALKACQDESEARAAWRAYLASEDPFYEAHPPSKFFPSLDRWRVRVQPKKVERVPSPEELFLRELHVEHKHLPDSPEKRAEISSRFRERFSNE